jgi:hypothetical protein
MGGLVALAFAWPLVDARLQKHTKVDVSVYVGFVAVLAIIGLTVWEAAVAH